jgi:hypothetical protein
VQIDCMSAESDIEGIDARVEKMASTTADGVSVTRRSVDEEIAWDRYKRSVSAGTTANRGPGFRIQQIVPSGGPQ